jgi:hypothetical protein
MKGGILRFRFWLYSPSTSCHSLSCRPKQREKPMRAFVVPWFAQREREVERSTAFMDRRAVTAFVEAHPLVTDVTKGNVAKWIERRRRDVTAATVAKLTYPAALREPK